MLNAERDERRGGEMRGEAIVLGLGVSGEAAALLLARKGWRVAVVDRALRGSHSERAGRLEVAGIKVFSGQSVLPPGDWSLAVVSPGISAESAWVRQLAACGAEVISELELGYRNCRAALLAVTGTNGKSTLVKLLHEMLTAGGLRSALAGNYGIPLCDVVEASSELDWVVTEVSSFQLELVKDFRPRVGILLNVQPDHLDRHGSMDEYAAIKGRLFSRMGKGDIAIIPGGGSCGGIAVAGSCEKVIKFGGDGNADVFYDADGHRIAGMVGGVSLNIAVSGTGFDNPVTGQTAAAAAAAAVCCGVGSGEIGAVLSNFRFDPHRMEYCGCRGGVRFVNDSKATNLAAMAAGIEMCGGVVRLIAGGELKEKSAGFVKEVLAKHTVCVYLIGSCAGYLESVWCDVAQCRQCGSLENAVKQAWREAVEGDVILLSPGCASFDQFRSYKERGSRFKKLVEEIGYED